MDKLELTALEQAAIDKLLEGDDDVLRALRGQLASATVSSRTMTGVGFFSNFSVPESLGRITDHLPNIRSRFVIGGVMADIDGVEHGAGFLLFVTDGRLDFLEGYVYVGTWPSKIEAFKVYCIFDPRNMDKLREGWLM